MDLCPFFGTVLRWGKVRFLNYARNWNVYARIDVIYARISAFMREIGGFMLELK